MRARGEVEGDRILSSDVIQIIRSITQSRLGDVDIEIGSQGKIGAQDEEKTISQELRPRHVIEHLWIFRWIKCFCGKGGLSFDDGPRQAFINPFRLNPYV